MVRVYIVEVSILPVISFATNISISKSQSCYCCCARRNEPFVCNFQEKNFCSYFLRIHFSVLLLAVLSLLLWPLRLLTVFCSIFHNHKCVVEYANEERESTTEVFYGSFYFIDFNRANDKRKRFRCFFAESDCRNILISEFKLCVLWAHAHIKWGSNKLHNERTCYAWLLIYTVFGRVSACLSANASLLLVLLLLFPFPSFVFRNFGSCCMRNMK